MTYLFQRVVRNDRGWSAPSSGRLHSLGGGGYLRENGFGHEDWNFCLDKCADGYVHGYMYYVPKEAEGPFNILFATYEKGEGWALVGFYENASFQMKGAEFPADIIQRRAQELKGLEAKNSLGGEYLGSSVKAIGRKLVSEQHNYRWAVRSDCVHRLQFPIQLPKSLTARFGAYFTRPTELSKIEWNKIIELVSDFKDKSAQDNYSNGGDIEFPEGRKVERQHTVRERNSELVVKAKAQFKKKHGRLYCEVCKFDFEATYGGAGCDFIEVHHIIPVCELEPGTKTKISDLAMVCSNCHRMLHRRRPWLSISALRKLISV